MIRGTHKDYVRPLDPGSRYALTWVDAQHIGLIVGSIHLKDDWTADAEASEAQLKDFETALQRMREVATVEVALGGDWNVDRTDLETEPSARAAVLADFVRRHGLEARASGRGTWCRPNEAGGDKELDYWLTVGSWQTSRVEAERLMQVGSDHTPASLTRAGRAAGRFPFWRRGGRRTYVVGLASEPGHPAAATHQVNSGLGPRPGLADFQRILGQQAVHVSSEYRHAVSVSVDFSGHMTSSRTLPPHGCTCNRHGRACMCGRDGARTEDSCLAQECKVGRLRTRLKAAIDRGAPEQELVRLRRAA